MGSFLELKKIPISILQSIFCSSFFLCLQGQSELCGSYHLLQSWFSFFVRLHGQLEPFGSYHLLQSCFSFLIHLHGQSCSSFFFCLHGQPEVLLVTTCSSLRFLSNNTSLQFLRVASRCFSSFASYPQPFFPLLFSL